MQLENLNNMNYSERRVNMKHKKKKIKIVCMIITLIMCVCSLVFLTFISRSNRKCIESKIIEVKLLKAEDYINNIPMRNNNKREEVLENIGDYICLHYEIKAQNTSNDYIVQNISFEPKFTKEMNDSIVAYASDDEICDNSIHTTLNKNQEKSYWRLIIIKKNGLSDDEIIEKAKDNNFQAHYFTTNDKDSILSLGYSKQIVPSMQ